MDLPSLPPEIEALADRGRELELLRGSAGYAQFLEIVRELRATNYLEILGCEDRDKRDIAVGEGRALLKMMTLLDGEIARGAAVTNELDAQMEAIRLREAAATKFQPRVVNGPARRASNFDIG